MSLADPQSTLTAAVVIWYHPSSEYVDNIRTYARYVDHLIIIDNSDTDNRVLLHGVNAHYIPLLANEGIAAALNHGIAKARTLQAEWVLTMDQDSRFSDSDIQALQASVHELAPQPDIAAIGVLTHPEPKKVPERKDVDRIITSGSMNRLSALEEVGGFNEKLFIDCVDFDLCHRLRRAGYRIVLNKEISLEHHLGERRVAHLRRRDYVTRNHSPTRYYYQIRNNLYLARHFPEYRRQAKREVRLILRNVVLFEKYKVRKLAAISQGLLHFVIGRYGPR